MEGIRAVLPYKMRNQRTKIYRGFVSVSLVTTPILFASLVLNHIFRWDVSALNGNTGCFIILLAILILSECINIHEMKAIKMGKEEVTEDED